eukprot:6176515-Pleurochrysis_carterae.AAC.1
MAVRAWTGLDGGGGSFATHSSCSADIHSSAVPANVQVQAGPCSSTRRAQNLLLLGIESAELKLEAAKADFPRQRRERGHHT